MTAVLDAWDALDLEAALSDAARGLRCLGDDRPLDVRRADALGLLARPQRVLHLGQPAAGDTDADGQRKRSDSSVINSYVHTSRADLARFSPAQSGPPTVVEAGSDAVDSSGRARASISLRPAAPRTTPKSA